MYHNLIWGIYHETAIQLHPPICYVPYGIYADPELASTGTTEKTTHPEYYLSKKKEGNVIGYRYLL
jgi:hypothetical protein